MRTKILHGRVGGKEQASGSFMTGMRAFSAHLSLTSLLWPSTAFQFFVYYIVLSGEYRCLVLSGL